MRIIFMGSAALAVPSLQAILSSSQDEIVGVVSQPDRPAGRKRVLTPCPLKAFADERGLHVMTPEKIGDPDAVEALHERIEQEYPVRTGATPHFWTVRAVDGAGVVLP